MAKIKINGDSSGYVEIAAPNAANNNTLELGPGTKILTDSNPLSDIGSIGIATDNPGSGNILAAYGRTQLGPQSDASDATTKAEMLSKASLRVKPHPTNSGALNFAQVDNGNGIGLQFTNGTGSANWNMVLQPFGGKVAIGTDSPNKVLKVEYPDPGSGSDGLTQIDAGNDTTTFFGTVGPTYNYIGHQGHAGMVYSSRDLAIAADHNNSGIIKFYTGNNERLRITSTGNIGIGTDNPNSAAGLDVLNGEICARGIRSSASKPISGVWLGKASSGNAVVEVVGDTGSSAEIDFTSPSTDTKGRVAYDLTNNYMYFYTNGANERLRITSDGDLVSSNITISSFSNTHNVGNYSVFLADNHANTFFGQNLRLDYNGANNSGNHQLRVINQHASIGGAGILIGGNGSSYVNQLKFYTVAANQPAGTRVDDTAARMTIDTVGRVTKPNQPAFCVYKNQSQWVLSSGDTFVFNTAEFNVGGHYNTTNGRFTAPVTGTYVFHFYSIYTGNAGNDYIQMYKNGARINVGDVHFTNSVGSQWDAVHYSRVIQLNANDYVYMRAGSGHTFHGNNWGGWSGYMLG
jgi:hypothetical protein